MIKKGAIGNYLNITDVSSLPMNINVIGDSYQATRKGYNLLDYINKIENNGGLTYTVDKDTGYIIANGTPTWDYATCVKAFNIDDLLEDGETYSIWQEVYSETSLKGLYIQITMNPKNDGTTQFINSSTTRVDFRVNKSEYSYTIAIQCATKSIAGTFSNYKNRYMFYKGTDNKEFELYGISPSLDYPSEIEAVGDNINIFDGEILENKGYNQTTGALEDNSTTFCNKNYIPVSKGKILIQEDLKGIITRFYFYNINKEYISNIRNDDYGPVEVPDQACFMNFQVGKSTVKDWSKVKIEKGEKITSYSPPGQGSIEIVHKNKNVLYIPDFNQTQGGVTCTVTNGNHVKIVGKDTEGKTFIFLSVSTNPEILNAISKIVLNKTVTLSKNNISNDGDYEINFSTEGNNWYLQLKSNAENKTQLIKNKFNRVAIYVPPHEEELNLEFDLQLEISEEPTEIVAPYNKVYNMPIQKPFYSDGTFGLEDKFVYQNMKWYEGHSHRKINLEDYTWTEETVASSTENYTKAWHIVEEITVDNVGINNGAMCNYMKNLGENFNSSDEVGFQVYNGVKVRLPITIASTREEVKEYFTKLRDEGESCYIIYSSLYSQDLIECTQEQLQVLGAINSESPFSPIANIYSPTTDLNCLEVRYVSLDEASKNTINPSWVEKDNKKIFPITHSRALLGGISSKAYNIDDSVYGNNWNNVIENGLYYDNNGYNRPPVGINTYPDNLLIEVKNIKDKYVIQEVSMFNTELFNISDRETVGYIRDRYGRKGSYNQDGSVTWSSWNAISTESDINRVYTEDKSSTTTDRKISMSDISSIDQLLNKVIYIKSISIGESGEATLNVNEFGAKPLRTPGDGTFTSNLEENWIITDQIYSVSYDGNNFNIVGAGGSGGGSGSGVVKSSDKSNIDWLTMTPEEFENAKVQGLLKDGTVYNVLDESVTASSSNPVGSVLIWFGLLNKIPANYVLCDGRLLNVAEYPVYADRYGNMYGGDGSKTVGVPNISGKVVVSLDSNQTEFNALGKTGGSKSVTLTEGQIPSHSHKVSGTAGAEGNKTMILTGTGATGDEASISDTSSVGGGESHTNLQPYIVGYYIIKVRPEAYSEDVTNLDKKISILKTTGDGNKYLSDDGTYKEIPGVSGDYLPLSGGVLTTNSYNGIEMKRNSDNAGSSLKYSNMSGVLGKIGFNADGTLVITNGTGADGTPNMLQIAKDGSIKIYNNLLPNTNNSTSLGSSNNKFSNIYSSNFNGDLKGTSDKSNSIVFSQLTNEDLNDFHGEAYVGKSYYAAGGNTIANKPSGVNNFGLSVLRLGAGVYMQVLWENQKVIFYYRVDSTGSGSGWSEWITVSSSNNNGQEIQVDSNIFNYPDGHDITSYISVSEFNNLTNGDIVRITSGTTSGAYIYSQVISIYEYTNNGYSVKLVSLVNSSGVLERLELSYDSSSNKVYIGSNGPNSGGGQACFTENTKVYTSEGLINISDIDIGSKVLSYNRNNELELKEVDKIVSHTADKIYKINIDAEIIETTWSHPFYTENRGKVLAKDLQVGDILKCYDNRLIEIKSIEIDETPEDVYEIRIKDNNNYFVGYNSILVYNEDSILDE